MRPTGRNRCLPGHTQASAESARWTARSSPESPRPSRTTPSPSGRSRCAAVTASMPPTARSGMWRDFIDSRNHHVTHVLLQKATVWGRKEVAIPISAVTGADDRGIQLNLAKNQIRDLPGWTSITREGGAGHRLASPHSARRVRAAGGRVVRRRRGGNRPWVDEILSPSGMTPNCTACWTKSRFLRSTWSAWKKSAARRPCRTKGRPSQSAHPGPKRSGSDTPSMLGEVMRPVPRHAWPGKWYSPHGLDQAGPTTVTANGKLAGNARRADATYGPPRRRC